MPWIRLTTASAAVLVLGLLVSLAMAQNAPRQGAGPVDPMTQMHDQHGGMSGMAGGMMHCPYCGMPMGQAKVTHAKAVLMPTQGNDVHGTVTFEQQGPLLVVTAEVRGLEPGSTHGIHIHEYGDISAPDGTAAGGHYNPEDMPHALPHDPERHAGDLGNIEANDQGVATKTIKVRNASLMGINPVLGRAVILHAKEDDGGQPTGNAGARLAQGVIGVDKAPDSDQ